MQIPRIAQRARLAPGRRRSERRHEPREPRPCPADRRAASASLEPDQRRERATPGPEDRALFSCRCGSVFQAPVTASVGCPHCGEPQAW
jgi:hypothetical protein